jgi:PAS domain S-box-containing protein
MAAIVESSQDAILSRSLDGTILTWNPGAERLFGYPAAEAIGRHYHFIVPPELLQASSHSQALFEQGETIRAYETLRIAKDGRRIQVSLRTSPIKSNEGSVRAVSAIVRDITQDKQAEQALRESEERFRQLAENIREVFWITTPSGDQLIYVSPAYAEIWGRSCESLYRNPQAWMESIHPDDLPAVRNAQRRMPDGHETDVEYRIIRPDGTLRWIRDRSYPMKRGDGTPLTCGIAEDITARKRAEDERIAHAIHQRDALVREVHHRIKNHLQGIAGLLRNKAADNSAAAATIEAAVAQLQSVAVVYGLQSELAESGVPLCRMLEAICASGEGLSAARIVRGFAADAGRIRLAETEAVPVAVALNELVFNAIEHGTRRGATPAIEVALTEKKNSAEIRIVNRGTLPRRFDYARGIGTGTGLDLVKTLLGPSGSRLEYAARDGKVEVMLSLRPPLVAVRRRRVSALAR